MSRKIYQCPRPGNCVAANVWHLNWQFKELWSLPRFPSRSPMLTMMARLQVEATDADKGDNAEVEYSLVTSPSSPKSFFSIDRTTGQLTTLRVGGQTRGKAEPTVTDLFWRRSSLCDIDLIWVLGLLHQMLFWSETGERTLLKFVFCWFAVTQLHMGTQGTEVCWLIWYYCLPTFQLGNLSSGSNLFEFHVLNHRKR